MFAQSNKITGVVLDFKTKTPIPGVSVVEKTTTNGMSTDIDGKFTITMNDKNGTLMFSFIGYETTELKPEGKTDLRIMLKESKKQLKEVVVLGYGTLKTKEAVVGSVEQVKADDLSKHSSAISVDQMLEGQVAGVRIESESGDPTSPLKVRIRGDKSIEGVGSGAFSASSEPLYILDGVPLYDALNPNINTGTEVVTNPLALINPEDIETITVLKDASAAAIYGANGANGVVILTTKKGAKGKTRVNLSHKLLISTPINKIELLDSKEYTELLNEYTGDNKEAPDFSTDWRDQTLQTAVSNQTNLSISGGDTRVTYRLSASYKDNETTSKGNDFETVTTRLNLNMKLYDNVDLEYNGGITSFETDKYNAFGTYLNRPTDPIYDENGDYHYLDGLGNPLQVMALNENTSKKFYSNNSLNLRVKINKNFKSTTRYGIDYTNKKNNVFESKDTPQGKKYGGRIREVRGTNRSWIASTQLDYTGKLGVDHSFAGTFGYQLKKDFTDRTTTTDTELVTDILHIPGQGSEGNQDISAFDSEDALRSYYARASYDYKKRYFFSANYRSDATSYFGGDKQVENFMSVGASWIISKEGFWKQNDIIHFLKLKLSYGKVGNSKVGGYSATGIYNYSLSSVYNNQIIAQPYTAPNEDLGWQKTNKLNVGLTMKMFKKLNLDIEYYNEKTIDGIMGMKVAPETGWNTINVNAAEKTNTGIEASLKLRNLILGPVRYTASFNIAHNTSKLDKLANNLDQIYSTTGLIVGESTDLMMGYKYAGVDPQTGAPQFMLKDGTITSDKALYGNTDQIQIIGHREPDFSGGFTNSFSYKNIDLSFLVSYEFGGDLRASGYVQSLEKGSGISAQNKSVNLLDRWQNPGDITDIPKLSSATAMPYQSSAYIFDKTNISLKSISLGYQLPKDIISRIKLNSASVGLQVSNIYTWYKDDSKSGRNGIAEYRYSFPQARTFAFNIKLGF
jgi:TonB-linked SusC/RagA family outer membrane protein